MSAITTHVLDTTRGRPASGVAVLLEMSGVGGGWSELARGTTDADGRVRDLVPPEHRLEPGSYRLTFETGPYFSESGVDSFYPQVSVVFHLPDPGEHYHVPLLLSPFGYSTYRGS